MKFRLWTVIWEVVFVKTVPDKQYVIVGECDYDAKIIKILEKLRGLERLDTLIHEMLHAVVPGNKELFLNNEELFINSVASDMAEVLWHYGYRNQDEKPVK